MNTPENAPMNKTVQDIYPLSPTQQGLLFHSLSDTQAGAYIVQVSYTLKGELNREAFDQAWQQMANRHTILRSAFVWKNIKVPVQVVGHQVNVPIHWHQWKMLGTEVQKQQLSELLVSDRAQGFNLSHAPLMRINAIQIGLNHYKVVWTHHHILLDGWSLPKLLKEWIVYYQATCGQVPATQVKHILSKAYPYRDYIAWLQKQDVATARQFWRGQLSGLSAPTNLGIDAAKPASLSKATKSQQTTNHHSAEQHYALPAQLTEQLKAFAKRHRLTLSTLYQGAWAKVLSVYSGDDDVMYGLACAGRPQTLKDAEQRVGLFINTLPMRVKLGSDIVPWLQSIQTQQLAQQPYEYTPLIEIQAESEISRQSPLFESVVVFENYPLESIRAVEGLELLEVEIIERTHYLLTLFAVVSETLDFKILYDAQRFSGSAIARLTHHLETVLAEIVTSPQQSVEKLNILSKVEKQEITSFGQGPTVSLSEAECVHVAIAQKAKQTPQATALIFEGNSLSYEQLNNQANQLAHYLLNNHGLTNAQNMPVGLCIERSVEMITALLAVLKAGCAYVPLDPTYPAARLQHIIEDAGITHLICHEATASVVSTTSLNRINLSQQSVKINAQSISEPDTNNKLNSLAYLIYTSGSTGKPKGVPITHRSLTNLLRSMATRLRIRTTDTLMAVTTLAFDIAALELFLPLTTGGCLLLASSQTARDAHQLIAYLDTYGIDIMQATPATWRLLLSGGWSGQNGLRILCGGEALDTALAERLLNCGEEVWNVYGPTETTIWSSALALSSASLTEGSVPIGQPIDNTQLYVLNEKQQMMPTGVAGELYIGGVGLSTGYWQREDLTKQRFVSVLIDSDEKTLYRTGDRVRYREDGTLDYLGRLDYQTKLRGYRIELGEIERVLATHPQISQAVTAVQEEVEKQQLVAYVTLIRHEKKENRHKETTLAAKGQPLTQELRSHLTRQLPHYMVPTAYQVLDAFPLTPNGKIDRNALPALTSPSNQAVLTPDSRPKTAIETTLLSIWQSLLPTQTISIHDNFFEIGGHSLLVISAQDNIRQQLAVELSLVDLFRYPTLRSLALHISQIKARQQGESELEAAVQPQDGLTGSRLAAGKQRLRQRLGQKRNKGQLSTQKTTHETTRRLEEEAK
ncbi:non-ribosomal peptide synthetase [cf. Phormidesmis sp. LEGE 11477]|uniref:non-ribosomal peptide synthetase n=1 Tax=cf. Phormidesmis sp. LEGE 11477 TaxID=1828680 RepID=UPI001882C578|nr:non-ribosomal peptide synthetase [cf. Phormidesmis sp. LEGE 11477]MBE9060862.1 amino acid adenylation domain-containing protein [cf. Phormidesmis sp. LEGE 11477]